MKIVKRILTLLTIVLLYVIVKEFLELYVMFKSIHPAAGVALLVAVTGFAVYFIVVPALKILRIPRHFGPTQDEKEVAALIARRMENFKSNEYLANSGFDFSAITKDEEGYGRVVRALDQESERIRGKYVSRLFYSSTVSQNGFIDALLVLSTSVNLVKEIFILYNGRVSNRDLLTIGRKVYYAMAIAGSGGVEYATEEIISKLATEGLRGIPFVDKILGSIADGFVNAVLLTRIALITENFCRLVYVKSERDLYPSPRFVLDTTKQLTAGMTDKLKSTLGKMAVEKSLDFGRLALNPASYVMGESLKKATAKTRDIASEKGSVLKESLTDTAAPLGRGALALFRNYLRRNRG